MLFGNMEGRGSLRQPKESKLVAPLHGKQSVGSEAVGCSFGNKP